MGAWLRHPLHPALAHFPLAFWIGASLSDLMGLGTGTPVWWTVSHHAIAAGTVAGALTLLAGLLELWLRRVPREALTWLIVHASLMFCALLCFMVSLAWRVTAPPPMAALAVSFAGSAIVLAGGFCGGTLVYRYGVGVSWREQGKANP
jgi:uncharacterized membrane protein